MEAKTHQKLFFQVSCQFFLVSSFLQVFVLVHHCLNYTIVVWLNHRCSLGCTLRTLNSKTPDEFVTEIQQQRHSFQAPEQRQQQQACNNPANPRPRPFFACTETPVDPIRGSKRPTALHPFDFITQKSLVTASAIAVDNRAYKWGPSAGRRYPSALKSVRKSLLQISSHWKIIPLPSSFHPQYTPRYLRASKSLFSILSWFIPRSSAR